jgi:hypothetical protein
MQGALGTLTQLLASANLSDVTEAISLLICCDKFGIAGSKATLRQMLPLIFAREQGRPPMEPLTICELFQDSIDNGNDQCWTSPRRGSSKKAPRAMLATFDSLFSEGIQKRGSPYPGKKKKTNTHRLRRRLNLNHRSQPSPQNTCIPLKWAIQPSMPPTRKQMMQCWTSPRRRMSKFVLRAMVATFDSLSS